MDKPWRLSLIGLVLVFGLVNAVPYSKYGRSCKDIGCRSNEVCVMAEDPCTLYSRDQCGRYPTCTRATDGMSCTTMICPTGQYCKTMNGRPTCVNTSPNLEDEGDENKNINRRQSSTIESTAGKATSSSSYPSYPTSQNSNRNNPVPSAPYESSNGYPVSSSHPGSSGYPANSGYPPTGNSGYPPSSNSGYPAATGSGYPYPTNSGYPSRSPSGYPSATGSIYPDNNTQRRTSNSNVNSGYPNYQYPSYPQAGTGYPQGNSANYPYNNPGYPQNGQYPPQQKKPSIGEQLTNFAKNLATRVLTQAIVDKVSGKS